MLARELLLHSASGRVQLGSPSFRFRANSSTQPDGVSLTSAQHCVTTLLGEAAGTVAMTFFHSPHSPFYLEAAARTPETRAAIANAMESVCSDSLFVALEVLPIEECDSACAHRRDVQRREAPRHGFRTRQPLLLLRGPADSCGGRGARCHRQQRAGALPVRTTFCPWRARRTRSRSSFVARSPMPPSCV
jgi:hypothetical protein